MLKFFTKGGAFLFSVFLLILFYIPSFPAVATAARIAAVQSINIRPYNDAFSGIESACKCNIERYVVSEMRGVDIAGELRAANPDVVIAIGMDALDRVRTIRKPVVYLMVINPQLISPVNKYITGVSMNIAAGKQISVLKQALPEVRRLAVLYDPANMSDFVKRAKKAALSTGIDLVTREVYASKDYPSILRSLKGWIDAVWMLPDVSLITPETVEFLFLFSMSNRTPVITFSDKYIDLGAVISLDINPYDIGRQAGEIVNEIVSGKDVKSIKRADARKLEITINQRAAKKLGIAVSKEALDKAKVINKE